MISQLAQVQKLDVLGAQSQLTGSVFTGLNQKKIPMYFDPGRILY